MLNAILTQLKVFNAVVTQSLECWNSVETHSLVFTAVVTQSL